MHQRRRLTWRHVGKARLDLVTRRLLPQNHGTTLVVAYNVERVLADIDADHGDCALELLGQGTLLLLRPFPSILSLLGRENGRTTPSADPGSSVNHIH
jgi:hypothetical protein